MTMIITDPWFYATAVPATLLYAIGKGGLGQILGIVAVPLMSITIDPIQAAGIMLPLLCVMDALAMLYHAKNCDWDQIRLLWPGAVLGIIIAAFFIGIMPEFLLRLFIGSLSIIFCLQFYLTKNNEKKSPGKLGGYIWSTIGGISSMAIHSGGGPMSIYLLPLKLDKIKLIGTMAVLFGFMNFFKLIPYTILGELNGKNLMTSLVLMPLAPIGIGLGIWLLPRVSQKFIYQLCYILLFFSGGILIWQGFAQVM